MEKSNGHICFKNGKEYFVFENCIYWAYDYAPMTVDGYRNGARFEGYDKEEVREYLQLPKT